MKPAKLGTAGKWRENTIRNFRPIVSQAIADFGIAYPHPKYQCDDEHDQGVLHSSLAILFSQEFFHWMHTANRSQFSKLFFSRSPQQSNQDADIKIANSRRKQGSHEPKFPFARNDNVDGRSCPPFGNYPIYLASRRDGRPIWICGPVAAPGITLRKARKGMPDLRR
jgi:hypothetical protein